MIEEIKHPDSCPKEYNDICESQDDNWKGDVLLEEEIKGENKE